MNNNTELTLRIICDNEARSPGVIPTNSLSIYINDEILIDACSGPDEFTHNIRALNINLRPRLAIITTPVNHHWGGLVALRGIVNTVIIPTDNTWFGSELRGKLEELGFDVFEVGGNERLRTGFGELELIRVGNKRVGELLIYVPSHGLLISGCGLGMWFINDDELLSFFKRLGIRYFVGGLGASAVSEYQGSIIRGLIRNLRGVYPLHGTGPRLRRELVSLRNVHDVGAGSVVRLGW
ncbi:hypothetical protein [Vulcanisaeta thermophila]|uniref:hypothetical protein n=1 Tax=Vulcanisaeta thermophila TaxID=867917 RepID=UPI0008537DDD|nr:hypothetical protein [Vulcanisaeta thermophila]